MEESMTYPSDPAKFMITLQNLDYNFSAPALQVKVNLTIYSDTNNNASYHLILPDDLYPIENSTYVDGTDTVEEFSVINTDLYFGEGLVLNGFLNTTTIVHDIIIHYKWTITVGAFIYTSPENVISVF